MKKTLIAALLFCAPIYAKDDESVVERVKAPKTLKISGKEIRSYRFEDLNGENFLVFSESIKKSEKHGTTHTLYVSHFATIRDGKMTLRLKKGASIKPTPKVKGKFETLRVVKDWVKNCELDLFAGFDWDALSFSDENKNGLAEFTFAYHLGCTGDVSPLDMKLVLLENGSKFIMRGEKSMVANMSTAAPIFDDSIKKAPKSFRKIMRTQWKKALKPAL